MTMPHERTRSIICTEQFLRRLLATSELPAEIRAEAKSLLRHYPSHQQILQIGRLEEALASLDPADPLREQAIILRDQLFSSTLTMNFAR